MTVGRYFSMICWGMAAVTLSWLFLGAPYGSVIVFGWALIGAFVVYAHAANRGRK